MEVVHVAEQGRKVVSVERVSMRCSLRKCVCGRLEGGGWPLCEAEEQEASQALIWSSRREQCTQVHWWNGAELICLPST